MPVCQLLTLYRLDPNCQGRSLRAVTAGWGWGEGFRAEGAMGQCWRKALSWPQGGSCVELSPGAPGLPPNSAPMN